MTESSFKLKISTSFIIMGYCAAIGMFYECAYWSVFKINIFEYISSLQILEISLFSAVPYFIIFFFGQLQGLIFSVTWGKDKTRKTFRADVPGDFVRFLKYHWFDWSTIIVGYIFIFLGTRDPQKFSYIWVGVPLVAVVMINAVLQKKELDNLFSNFNRVQRVLFYYSIVLPIFVSCYAKYSANLIFEGSKYYYADSQELKLKDASLKESLKYIGKLDEYLFFCDKTNNNIYVVPKDNAYPLKLMSYPAEKAIITPDSSSASVK